MAAPPRLHWGWVFLLSALTGGIFGAVWLLIQSNWMERVRGKRGVKLYIVTWICLLTISFISGFVFTIIGVPDGSLPRNIVDSVSGFGSFVLYLVCVYGVRSELRDRPFNIPLGGIMTFFFGPVYFQYWLQDFDTAVPTIEFTSGQPQFPQL